MAVLGGNAYIVRTQAGFKKAIKHYCQEAVSKEILGRVVGYPKVYPAMVVFYPGYRGYYYIRCKSFPFNKLREILRKHDTPSTQT